MGCLLLKWVLLINVVLLKLATAKTVEGYQEGILAP